jgi:alkylation response protein AidB-like acyl-CoA dehydrogenase
MTLVPANLQRGSEQSSSVAQNARALCTWLQSRAGEIEAAKRIPDDVVERLAAADLWRMTQPPRFGGLGCRPRDAWEAVFEIARGCGSCAWVVGLNSANVLMLGKFSDQAQRDVFLCGKPAIISMLTGGVGSNLTAE